ncbi:MAG: TonB-dependent receptor plug domain-containing protein, partial [Candidatus Marinimicrobia bacterium]|nr:TonB-dependent receptor plug domain-containing protein [Candidatus Neomarinimicrobiota bacterium]
MISRNYKYLLIGMFSILIGSSFTYAINIRGQVVGKLDKLNLAEALIVIEDPLDEKFKLETMSDGSGEFLFRDVSPGVYKIAALKDGYYSNCLFDFKIEENKNYKVVISLIRHKKDWNGEFCFMIGGVEVLSDEKELISETAMTIRQIHSGEIDHMQASSLGDVLSLVPGVEKTSNLGLAKESKVGLRSTSLMGTDGIIESFGTTIIVDGVEITNDANADGSGTSGIDLRVIPADNINSVKVITGIPSVEYGNFSNGIIEVETKSGIIQKKLKAKLNPDTKTFSLSDGYEFWGNRFNYHVNYGYSERNLRLEGDEFHRIHLGGTIKRETKQKTNIKLS